MDISFAPQATVSRFVTELDRDVVGISLDGGTRKDGAIPHSDDTPKGSRGWEEGKIIKTFGTKVLEIELVKNFSLGFL